MTNNITKALPCARCDKDLDNAVSATKNQPYGGTAFTSYGHYGSTIFDPANSDYKLELNLCDECLKILADRKQIFLVQNTTPRPTATYLVWDYKNIPYY